MANVLNPREIIIIIIVVVVFGVVLVVMWSNLESSGFRIDPRVLLTHSQLIFYVTICR